MINTNDLGIAIVDMQESFLKKIPEEEVKRLVKKQRRVLEVAAQKDIPVLVFEYDIGERTINEISENVKAVPRNTSLQKIYANGFEPEEIRGEVKPKDWFLEQKVKRILFSGVYATDCVADTGLGVRNAGFDILFSRALVNQDEVPFGGFETYFSFLGFQIISYKKLVRC